MDAKTKKAIRQKLYVDQDVQRTLIVRTILQWYFYMSAILLVICLGAIWMDPSQLAIKHLFKSFVYYAPGVIASVLLLPLFVYDMLKATNRIAGPIYRLRNEMKKLASGQEVRQLRFRDGDHWGDLAEDFNELAEAVIAERQRHNNLPEKEVAI